MGKEIQLWWEVKIKPGKASELRKMASALSSRNQSEERGTIMHHIYMNKEETLLTFVETYANADAQFLHAERFLGGEFVGPFLESVETVKKVVYGAVPQSRIDWYISQGFDFEVHPLVIGFLR